LALIDDFQQQIDARLSELQPAFAEYTALQQLREAIKSLDPEAAAAHVSLFPFPAVAGGDGATQNGPSADGDSPARRRRARAAAALQGPTPEEQTTAHTEAAIQLIAQEPGLTANQLAERMGVPASVLFRLLPTLQREGRVRKQGKGYRPV
jgi:predicted Rossmann fold nucleotide-binding protein DprA/Smf involved in DNA uptake